MSGVLVIVLGLLFLFAMFALMAFEAYTLWKARDEVEEL